MYLVTRERAGITLEQGPYDPVIDNLFVACGFHEVPDSKYGKSRTRVSVSPGHAFR